YIPIGYSIANATTSLDLEGNLNGGGTVATLGTVLESGVLGNDTDGDGAGDVSADGTTVLTDLTSGVGGGSTDLQIVANDIISLTATKGGRSITKTYTVTAASNVNALMTFMNQSLGIVDAVAPVNAGVALEGAGDQIFIRGNNGTANGITSLTLTNTGTTAVPKNVSFPSFTTTQTANGESGSTDVVVYDSTGIPHTVTFSFVLDAAAATGNTWRYYVESAETTDRQVSTGNIAFNTSGRLTTGITSTITVPTTIPVTFNVGLSSVTDFGSSGSSIALASQNGFAFGTLDDFSIGQNGKITGIFSNGITRDVAQIQLAKFSNPEGLEATDSNNYLATASSGPEKLVLPGGQTETTNGVTTFVSAGTTVSGALEASNVDVAQEFTHLIVGQRAFQANARVISVTDAMLQDLLQTI
ncbi:flagellar hook-basal body complex protein, partial [Candidatus Peregrinibacteria bacterium]|nr:flagellar hook-basal body complex protein [Candidatus Peregrinibacteria bacterium]